jgi:hypothetical protein
MRTPYIDIDVLANYIYIALIVYGGYGFGQTSNGMLADIWAFDLPTMKWNWMGMMMIYHTPAHLLMISMNE